MLVDDFRGGVAALANNPIALWRQPLYTSSSRKTKGSQTVMAQVLSEGSKGIGKRCRGNRRWAKCNLVDSSLSPAAGDVVVRLEFV